MTNRANILNMILKFNIVHTVNGSESTVLDVLNPNNTTRNKRATEE